MKEVGRNVQLGIFVSVDGHCELSFRFFEGWNRTPSDKISRKG